MTLIHEPFRQSLSSATPTWQAEKHLRSGDRVWILTDVERYSSSFYAWSEPQDLYRIGICDLRTHRVGLANFGRDVAYAMMRAGFSAPPWNEPLPFGVELRRLSHHGEEKGRYVTTVTLLPIDDRLHAILPRANKQFAGTCHCPNATPNMWDDLVARAQREIAIEAAALGMVGPFSAGDVRKKLGDPDTEVVRPVLKRLVREGKLLPPTGKKRGTRYRVARAEARLVRLKRERTHRRSRRQP